MATMSLNQILTAVLLAALVVLVIFLIVFTKNAIQTVKKANTLLDEGIETVDNVKQKYSDIKGIIVKSKIVGFADTGLHFVKLAVKKAKERKGTTENVEDSSK